MRVFITNESENKAVNKNTIKTLNFYKSKNKDHVEGGPEPEDHWIVYGRFIDDSGGFMFGKFEKMNDAKTLFKKILKEFNTL